MTTHIELAEELNLVAEYAEINLWIEVEPTETEGNSLVKLFRSHDEEKGSFLEEVVVDTHWAMGNARRLADQTDEEKFVEALALSHPSIMQIPDHTPSTVSFWECEPVPK